MIPTGPAPLLRPFTLKGADQLGTRRSTCRSTVATSLTTLVALLLVVAVITLVAWALQLMQAATDRQEFSLMLTNHLKKFYLKMRISKDVLLAPSSTLNAKP